MSCGPPLDTNGTLISHLYNIVFMTTNELEINYLILSYLRQSPALAPAAIALEQQMINSSSLEKRVDWQGSEHILTYDDLVSTNHQLPLSNPTASQV